MLLKLLICGLVFSQALLLSLLHHLLLLTIGISIKVALLLGRGSGLALALSRTWGAFVCTVRSDLHAARGLALANVRIWEHTRSWMITVCLWHHLVRTITVLLLLLCIGNWHILEELLIYARFRLLSFVQHKLLLSLIHEILLVHKLVFIESLMQSLAIWGIIAGECGW